MMVLSFVNNLIRVASSFSLTNISRIKVYENESDQLYTSAHFDYISI